MQKTPKYLETNHTLVVIQDKKETKRENILNNENKS